MSLQEKGENNINRSSSIRHLSGKKGTMMRKEIAPPDQRHEKDVCQEEEFVLKNHFIEETDIDVVAFILSSRYLVDDRSRRGLMNRESYLYLE